MSNPCLSSPKLYIEHSGTFEALTQSIDTAIREGASHLLILSCNNLNFELANLNQYLQSVPIPVFGGLYPGLIVENGLLERGSIVCSLPGVASTFCIQDLSATQQDFLENLQPFTESIAANDTLLLFIDACSQNLITLLDNLYELTGDMHCQYMGGGAGFTDFTHQPCLFSNQGLLIDSALLVRITQPVNITIEHGWRKVAGPFVITGSNENIITSLNYRPALEVFSEAVASDSGLTYQATKDEFKPFFQAYCLGLARLQGDITLREPLHPQAGTIVCAGPVPTNHMLYIMKATSTDLLSATERALTKLITYTQPQAYSLGLLFSCIGRILFLAEAAQQELDMLRQHLPAQMPLIGVLSVGEIADSGNICLEFLNKTLVLGVLQIAEATVA
jgi:hypothetical protein